MLKKTRLSGTGRRPHRANGIWGSLLELASNMFTKLYGQLGNKWFSTYLSTALSWTVHPQKIWWSPDPITMNVTLFKNVFADVIKLRSSEQALHYVLLRRRTLEPKKKRSYENTEGRWQYEDGGRNWRYAVTNQGTPGATNLWERRKSSHGRKDSPLKASEGMWPYQQLDLGLLASRTVLRHTVLWYFVTAAPGNKTPMNKERYTLLKKPSLHKSSLSQFRGINHLAPSGKQCGWGCWIKRTPKQTLMVSTKTFLPDTGLWGVWKHWRFVWLSHSQLRCCWKLKCTLLTGTVTFSLHSTSPFTFSLCPQLDLTCLEKENYGWSQSFLALKGKQWRHYIHPSMLRKTQGW